jgi:hypothetical protein
MLTGSVLKPALFLVLCVSLYSLGVDLLGVALLGSTSAILAGGVCVSMV